MKHSIRIMLVALAAVGLWRCSEQQPENSVPRDVQFTVRTTASAKSGRTADLPAGTELLLSINKSSGESEFIRKRIELLRLGDEYVSKAFKLVSGTYAVVDFMLVLGDSVLYATPHAGCPLADRVANPLPYSFTVSTDELLTLDAEVLATDGTSPAQFGYVAFDISGIEGRKIPITVFTIDQTGQRLADHVEVSIIEVPRIPVIPDTLVHDVLETGKGEVPFDLDPRRQYTLVVARHGFRKYIRNFYFSTLEREFSGGSLEITLNAPAFTYVTTGASYTRADITPNGSDVGQVTTDFNEYIIGPFPWDIGPGTTNYFEYHFRSAGDYFVTVEGDLDLIGEISLFPTVSAMDVTHLPELRSLPIYGNSLLSELDLSQNHKLVSLDASFTALAKARLSHQAPIHDVRIGNTDFTTETLSVFIDDVYAAAIQNNIHGGVFYYVNSATPTEAAEDKLQELQNRGWTITPGISGGD